MAGVPTSVLAAYGVSDAGRPLRGGQGTSVVADRLVFKPGASEVATAWFAEVCEQTEPRGFRLPAPVPALDGRLVVEGWSATTYVDGAHVDDHDRSAAAWLPVLEAGRAFHRAVSHLPRPAFLDGRMDRWAVADRAAWHETAPAPGARGALLLDRLTPQVRDERLADQVVHGDLSGNVLLHDGLAPAVIDVSPYWRPAAYADAVVVVDALLWWRADPSLVGLGRPPGLTDRIWRSLLARATVFRLLARAQDDAELDRYDHVTGLL